MSKMEFVFFFAIHDLDHLKAELELGSDKASSDNVSSQWFQEELGLVKKPHIVTVPQMSQTNGSTHLCHQPCVC